MGSGRRVVLQKKGQAGRLSFMDSLLLANPELVDDRAVPLHVDILEVVEKPAAPADELQKAAAAVMILRVRFEVLGQVGDPVRQQRDLHFRRTGIARVRRIAVDEVRFLLLGGGQILLLKRLTR